MYTVLQKSKDNLLTDVVPPATRDVPAGEIILDEVERHPVVPYERISLSNVWVEGSNNYFSPDGTTPMTDLELGFTSGGMKSRFTVTLFGKVFHRVRHQDNGKSISEDRGLVDVHSIDYVKGEKLSVILAYVPEGEVGTQEKLAKYCSIENDPLCSYIPVGFGTKPIALKSLVSDSILDGKSFSPSEVAVWYLSRNLVDPKVEQ